MGSQIFNVSINENIIKYTMERILSLHDFGGTDFSDVVVVMPSKRPSLFIKRELAKKIKKSFIPPVFFTFDELINEINKENSIAGISNIDSTYLIYETVKNDIDKNSFSKFNFSEFFQWSYEILNFINSLDVEKIDDMKLLNLKMNADIGYDLPDNINELLKLLYKIRKSFHKKLDSLKKTTRGYSYYNAYKYVCGYLKNYKKVILFNPYYLNGAETEMFKQIFNEGKLDIVLKGDSRKWTALRKIYKNFNCPLPQNVDDNYDYNVDIYAAYDGQSQACAVKNLILKMTQAERENTVVIVPDNAILPSVMSELYGIEKDINVSVGYPAKKTTVFALLDCLIQTQKNKNNDKYYVKDVLSLISNPLVKNMRFIGNPEVTRIIVHEIIKNFDRFDDKSLFNGYMFVSLEEITNNDILCKNISEKVSDYWQNVSPEKIREIIFEIFTLFITNFSNSNTMKLLGKNIKLFADGVSQKSFINTYQFNVGALNIVYDIAGQFESCVCADEIFASKELLSILEKILLKGNISLIGSPLKGLQILGLMESRGLTFDNVFVLSMTDSAVPSVTEVSPLIPKDISVWLGIGYSDRETDIQKYHFTSLISGAKKVSLIYPKSDNTVKSRFIEEIIWNKQFKEKSLKAAFVTDVIIANTNLYETKNEYEKTQEIKKYLLNFSYSSTSIDLYMECKLKFYYKYVLRLAEQVDYDNDYEYIDIGNCIHDFLKETFTHGLRYDEILKENFKVFYDKKLDEYLDKYFSNNRTGKTFLLRNLIKTKLEDFYNNELERKFKIILGCETDVVSLINIFGTDYRLKARIDRIDETEDGKTVIIDYKTGTIKNPLSLRKYVDENYSRQTVSKNINSFQLIIYKYLYEKSFGKTVDDCYLYSLKNCELKKLFTKEENKNETYSSALEQLKFVIAEINGDEPFKSESYDKVKCERCPYFYLCR